MNNDLFEELKNALTPLQSELQELNKYENAIHRNVMSIAKSKIKNNL